MDTESVHILAEFWGCESDLNDDQGLEDHLWRAAFEAKATPLDIFTRKFEPTGVSIFVVVAESHLSIHTWPEYLYASIDVFTCGEKTKPMDAILYLKEILEPRKYNTVTIGRGRPRGMQITSFSQAANHCKLGKY